MRVCDVALIPLTAEANASRLGMLDRGVVVDLLRLDQFAERVDEGPHSLVLALGDDRGRSWSSSWRILSRTVEFRSKAR